MQSIKQLTSKCENHLSSQSTYIQDIIQICSCITGHDALCFQINSLCKDVLQEETNFTEQLSQFFLTFTTKNHSFHKQSTKNSFHKKSKKFEKKKLKGRQSKTETYVSIKKKKLEDIVRCLEPKIETDSPPDSEFLNNADQILGYYEESDENESRMDEKEFKIEPDDAAEKHAAEINEREESDIEDEISDQNDESYIPKQTKKPKKTKSVSKKVLIGDQVPTTYKFQCVTCGKNYKQQVALEKHRQKCHGAEPMPLTCKFCGKESTTLSLHLAHERKHTQEKPVCEICGAVYKNIDTLRYHLMTHKDEKPFACDLCDFRCRQRMVLKCHRMRHTGEKNYACDECGKTFIRLEGFKIHLLHHKDKTPFPCDICGKRFSNTYHVSRHKKIHEGEAGSDEMYSCEVCGHRSRQKYNITVHMRTHTKEKPYTCSNCGEKFMYTVTLQQHKKSCFKSITFSGDKLE